MTQSAASNLIYYWYSRLVSIANKFHIPHFRFLKEKYQMLKLILKGMAAELLNFSIRFTTEPAFSNSRANFVGIGQFNLSSHIKFEIEFSENPFLSCQYHSEIALVFKLPYLIQIPGFGFAIPNLEVNLKSYTIFRIYSHFK